MQQETKEGLIFLCMLLQRVMLHTLQSYAINWNVFVTLKGLIFEAFVIERYAQACLRDVPLSIRLIDALTYFKSFFCNCIHQ